MCLHPGLWLMFGTSLSLHLCLLVSLMWQWPSIFELCHWSKIMLKDETHDLNGRNHKDG